jgi:hypothetical protein
LTDLTGVHRKTLPNLSSERLQSKPRVMVKVVIAAAALAGNLSKAIIFQIRNELLPIRPEDGRRTGNRMSG